MANRHQGRLMGVALSLGRTCMMRHFRLRSQPCNVRMGYRNRRAQFVGKHHPSMWDNDDTEIAEQGWTQTLHSAENLHLHSLVVLTFVSVIQLLCFQSNPLKTNIRRREIKSVTAELCRISHSYFQWFKYLQPYLSSVTWHRNWELQ